MKHRTLAQLRDLYWYAASRHDAANLFYRRRWLAVMARIANAILDRRDSE